PILPGEDEDHLVSDDAIWTLLARYGITEANVKILRATVYSHHVRFAARWRVGRVFLAGDAAHAMPPWIGQGMSAGVRDAANLCWKIASVVRGELSDDVLDSYEAERQPHVRDVTRRAVFAGRFITERRRILAMMRNPALRAIGRIGPLNAWLQRSLWIPAAQYPAGFLSESRPAVGRRLPQPDVLDAHGQRAKLDDVLGTGWVVMCLSGASVPSAWRRTGARALHIGSDVIDFNGVLISWMRAHNADIVALRPDGFIYAAAGAGHTLAPPPASLTITSYIRSNA
ncbi:MAG TPA: FAD-dependent monooxygenase, partial [Jatrophihabitantaceae bacterium]|nr:FAD-dependent monooxygenase [Jatrophihabitantaceae bacterium]